MTEELEITKIIASNNHYKHFHAKDSSYTLKDRVDDFIEEAKKGYKIIITSHAFFC